MKILNVALTVVLSLGLFAPAYAGKGGGGGGGGGGGRSGGGGGGGGGSGIGLRVSGGNSLIRNIGSGLGSGSNHGNIGSGNKIISNISSNSGKSPLRLLGQNGSPGSSNGSKSKGKISIHLGIGLGRSRCYYQPIVVCSSPDVLFAAEPLRAEEIASGGVIELPGNWGGEAGYACLMFSDSYAYFRVLEWTEKGVKLEVPRLEINGPLEAKLLMVRSDRYTYPEIPVNVLPPLADVAGAVAGAGKTEGTPADGSVAVSGGTNTVVNGAANTVTSGATNTIVNTAASTVAKTATGTVVNTVANTAANTAAKTDAAAKTVQTGAATPAQDATTAPADIDGEGTFEQVERAAAGNSDTAKAK